MRGPSAHELSVDQVLARYRLGPVESHAGSRVQPFPLLASFTTHDAATFFGRERETDELLGLTESCPRFVLYGDTGVGKSSLINCGLARALGPSGALLVRVGLSRPPFTQLAQRLWRQVLTTHADDPRLPVPGDLRAVLSRLTQLLGRPLVLFFDQCEQWFIAGSEHDREAFVSALRDALDRGGLPVRAVFSIKKEFLADLLDLDDRFDGFFTRTRRLAPMQPDVATNALMRSADVTGVRLEAREAEKIVALASPREEAVELARLQLLATRLWAQAASRRGERPAITPADIEALPNPRNILREHLIQALGQSSYPETGLAVLRALVSDDGYEQVLDENQLRTHVGLLLDGSEEPATAAELVPAHDFAEALKWLESQSVIRKAEDGTAWTLQHGVLARTFHQWNPAVPGVGHSLGDAARLYAPGEYTPLRRRPASAPAEVEVESADEGPGTAFREGPPRRAPDEELTPRRHDAPAVQPGFATAPGAVSPAVLAAWTEDLAAPPEPVEHPLDPVPAPIARETSPDPEPAPAPVPEPPPATEPTPPADEAFAAPDFTPEEAAPPEETTAAAEDDAIDWESPPAFFPPAAAEEDETGTPPEAAASAEPASETPESEAAPATDELPPAPPVFPEATVAPAPDPQPAPEPTDTAPEAAPPEDALPPAPPVFPEATVAAEEATPESAPASVSDRSEWADDLASVTPADEPAPEAASPFAAEESPPPEPAANDDEPPAEAEAGNFIVGDNPTAAPPTADEQPAEEPFDPFPPLTDTTEAVSEAPDAVSPQPLDDTAPSTGQTPPADAELPSAEALPPLEHDEEDLPSLDDIGDLANFLQQHQHPDAEADADNTPAATEHPADEPSSATPAEPPANAPVEEEPGYSEEELRDFLGDYSDLDAASAGEPATTSMQADEASAANDPPADTDPPPAAMSAVPPVEDYSGDLPPTPDAEPAAATETSDPAPPPAEETPDDAWGPVAPPTRSRPELVEEPEENHGEPHRLDAIVQQLPEPELARQFLQIFVDDEGRARAVPERDLVPEVAFRGPWRPQDKIQEAAQRLRERGILAEGRQTAALFLQTPADAAHIASWLNDDAIAQARLKRGLHARYVKYKFCGDEPSLLLDRDYLAQHAEQINALRGELDPNWVSYFEASLTNDEDRRKWFGLKNVVRRMGTNLFSF